MFAAVAVCLSLGLSLAVLDVGLRVFEAGRAFERVVPDQIGRFEYRINSKGFRGEETPYEKPPGVYRIVLIGDSNAFGYGVCRSKSIFRAFSKAICPESQSSTWASAASEWTKNCFGCAKRGFATSPTWSWP